MVVLFLVLFLLWFGLRIISSAPMIGSYGVVPVDVLLLRILLLWVVRKC